MRAFFEKFGEIISWIILNGFLCGKEESHDPKNGKSIQKGELMTQAVIVCEFCEKDEKKAQAVVSNNTLDFAGFSGRRVSMCKYHQDQWGARGKRKDIIQLITYNYIV